MEGDGNDGLESLIARAREHAKVALNCLEWAEELPDAAAGLCKAAGFHGERLAALADEIARETGQSPRSRSGFNGRGRARLPVGGERCDALADLLVRRA